MQRNALQDCFIDDSGDGIGNVKNTDGLYARGQYIGSAFLTGDDQGPTIGLVRPETVLSGSNALTLWAADVTDIDGISNVWCVIAPPGVSNALITLALPYAAAQDRYEAVYTNFYQLGTYFVTYYAGDLNGDVSSPRQGSVVRGDELSLGLDSVDLYDNDDAPADASFYQGLQVHNLHVSNDVDWIRFFAQTNFALEMAAVQLGTNVDLVMELFFENADGELVLLDSVDSLYADDDEYLYFSVPTNGFYYVRISQYRDGEWLAAGDYEFEIYLPLGGIPLVVVAVDGLLGKSLPPGASVVLDSIAYPFEQDGKSRTFLNKDGQLTVGVTGMPAGWLPAQDPDLPGQVDNPSNTMYGNPRIVNMDGGIYRSALFNFIPYVRAAARAVDLSLGAGLDQVEIMFHGKILTNAVVYDGYPNYAAYESRWYTGADGAFPTNVLLPATNWTMMLRKAGYVDAIVSNAMVNPVAGAVFQLGDIPMTPLNMNQSPVAAFELTTMGATLTVRCDAGASVDPDGAITNLIWDFDADGAADLTGPRAWIVTNSYPVANVYTARLSVYDNGNAMDQTSRVFMVGPIAPAGLRASAGQYSQRVQLDWIQALGATNYQVWRSTVPVKTQAVNVAQTADISWNDTAVQDGLNYYYWLRIQYNDGTHGALSTMVTGFPLNVYGLPWWLLLFE